jgi:hypothetical protein
MPRVQPRQCPGTLAGSALFDSKTDREWLEAFLWPAMHCEDRTFLWVLAPTGYRCTLEWRVCGNQFSTSTVKSWPIAAVRERELSTLSCTWSMSALRHRNRSLACSTAHTDSAGEQQQTTGLSPESLRFNFTALLLVHAFADYYGRHHVRRD